METLIIGGFINSLTNIYRFVLRINGVGLIKALELNLIELGLYFLI